MYVIDHQHMGMHGGLILLSRLTESTEIAPVIDFALEALFAMVIALNHMLCNTGGRKSRLA